MRRPVVIRSCALFVVCCLGLSAGADDIRRIRPIRSPDDMRLTLASAWTRESSPGQTQLFKMAYVAGFWDAVSLNEAGSQAIQEWTRELAGMDIEQIVATMDKFYSDYPQWRDWSPAIVLVGIVPRLRKGLPPVESK